MSSSVAVTQAPTTHENIVLLDQKAELVSLIDKVEGFPEQISYDALVPLSKVGFCRGKIVHTNEFIVAKPGNVPDQRISSATAPESFQTHTEVVALLRSKLIELEDLLGVKRTEFVSAPTINQKKPGSDRSDGSSKPPMRFTSTAASAASPSNEAVAAAKGEQKQRGKEEDQEPIYEIREYIDASGATKFEKVDVTQQFRAMNTMVTTETEKDGKTRGDVLLEQKMQQGGPASFAESGDLSFVRELCENSDMTTATSGSSSNSVRERGTESGGGGEEEIDLDAMFAKLETQEEELGSRQQQKRQEQQQQQQQMKKTESVLVKKSSGGGGSGWSSGFLKKGKSGVAAVAVAAAAAAAATSQPEMGSTAAERVVKRAVRFADGEDSVGVGITSKQEHKQQQQQQKGEGESPAKPPEVAAFSGSVVERQAPPAGPKPLVMRGAGGRGAGAGGGRSLGLGMKL